MKSRIFRKHAALMTVVVATSVAFLLLPGCASKHTVKTPSASVGQQLQDLDKAYKDGTINQKEYEKLRKAIIREND